MAQKTRSKTKIRMPETTARFIQTLKNVSPGVIQADFLAKGLGIARASLGSCVYEARLQGEEIVCHTGYGYSIKSPATHEERPGQV